MKEASKNFNLFDQSSTQGNIKSQNQHEES